MEERKTGAANNIHLQCNMCKQYKKENQTLEMIEKKLLNHADDDVLHKIIQYSSEIRTKTTLTNFLNDKIHITTRKPPTDDTTHTKVIPKIIARLANTLTLHSCAHNGSVHQDIDQPYSNQERQELQTESTTPCQCQTTTDQAA